MQDDTTIQRTPEDMAQIDKYLAHIQGELDKAKAEIDRPFEVKAVYTPPFLYKGELVSDSIGVEFAHPGGRKLVIPIGGYGYGVDAPSNFQLRQTMRRPSLYGVSIVREYVDQLYRIAEGGE